MLFCGGTLVSFLLVLPGRCCHELTTRSSRAVGTWAGLQRNMIFLSLCWAFLVNYETGVMFYSEGLELGAVE